jgi:putative hsp70 nucleotide exchange factor FES1
LFFSGKIEAEFDSVEVVETYHATLEILKENYVECIECKNKNKKIEAIAIWEGYND